MPLFGEEQKESDLFKIKVDSGSVRRKLVELGLNTASLKWEFYDHQIVPIIPRFNLPGKRKTKMLADSCFPISQVETRGRKNVVFSIGRRKKDLPPKVNINLGKEKGKDQEFHSYTSEIHAVLIADFDHKGNPDDIRLMDLNSTNHTWKKETEEKTWSQLEPGKEYKIKLSTLNPNGKLVYRDRIRFGGERVYIPVDTNGLTIRGDEKNQPISLALFEYA